jgi:hypothetical protein
VMDDAFSHESRLISKIMQHHTVPSARPVKDSSQPINVSIAFHLMQILSVVGDPVYHKRLKSNDLIGKSFSETFSKDPSYSQ